MPFWRKATNKAASESKAEKHSRRKAEAATPKSQRHTPSKRAPVGFPIVGIGASAGGLEAFTELLKRLPLDTGLGFVLVQHLDPQHESALTQILTRATLMPVREVTNNLRVSVPDEQLKQFTRRDAAPGTPEACALRISK